MEAEEEAAEAFRIGIDVVLQDAAVFGCREQGATFKEVLPCIAFADDEGERRPDAFLRREVQQGFDADFHFRENGALLVDGAAGVLELGVVDVFEHPAEVRVDGGVEQEAKSVCDGDVLRSRRVFAVAPRLEVFARVVVEDEARGAFVRTDAGDGVDKGLG